MAAIWLRTTEDNLGLYENSQIEAFLVAIVLETSAEQYWPVYRGLRTVDYSDDGEQLDVDPDPDDLGTSALIQLFSTVLGM